jgi:hypothetical protein
VTPFLGMYRGHIASSLPDRYGSWARTYFPILVIEFSDFTAKNIFPGRGNLQYRYAGSRR